jgi:transposase
MDKPTTIAVDLANSVFEIAVSKQPGRVCQRRRLSRRQMASFFSAHPASTVLMEACGSAHYWGRLLKGQGHQVRLLPPHHVRRYRLGNKTDRADADALLEAGRNQQIIAVPVKTVGQQTLIALHNLRSGWISTRTARLNTLRGLLRELGIVIPKGPRHVLPSVAEALSSEDVVPTLHTVVLACCEEIRQLERNIRQVEGQLSVAAKQIGAAAQSLLSVPGIGLLTATAMLGFVGSACRFRSGRRYASFLGLVPKEFSSGNIRRLGAISKRGDGYLRTLLIHGARAVLVAAKRSKKPDRLRCWALQVEKRRGHNRTAVALANKLARIAWAVWSSNTQYQPAYLSPCS